MGREVASARSLTGVRASAEREPDGLAGRNADAAVSSPAGARRAASTPLSATRSERGS
ncbi:hypothetical protein [Streptomyces sp. NPDC001492]